MVRREFATALTLLLIASCSPYNLARGPDPVIRANAASSSTTNYLQVRDEFIRRAGYSSASSVSDWYNVALAGFGYVDEECTAYLSALEQVRRNRDHIKRQLTSIGTATTGLLGITRAGEVAIAITAGAFGLASQITDNASASVLYSMESSDVKGLVQRQMEAYKDGVAAQRHNYSSSVLAMDAVRGYLNLCLPISIEAQIKETVQSTVYVAATSSTGAPRLLRTQTASPGANVPTVQQIRQDPNLVRPTVPLPDGLAKNTLPGEFAITREQAMTIQGRLCVVADGDLGKLGSNTRAAFGIVQTEILKTSPSYKLDQATWLAARALPVCVSEFHKNTFEHVALPNPTTVEDLQKNLRRYITEDAAFTEDDKKLVAETDFVGGDRLTPKNREAIKAIQRIMKTEQSGEYTPQVSLKVLP